MCEHFNLAVDWWLVSGHVVRQRDRTRWCITTPTRAWRPCWAWRTCQPACHLAGTNCWSCSRGLGSWRPRGDASLPRKPTSETKRYASGQPCPSHPGAEAQGHAVQYGYLKCLCYICTRVYLRRRAKTLWPPAGDVKNVHFHKKVCVKVWDILGGKGTCSLSQETYS